MAIELNYDVQISLRPLIVELEASYKVQQTLLQEPKEPA